jgi:hypothetical protein
VTVKTNAENWESLYAPDPLAYALRARTHRQFNELFDKGHRTSIREFAAEGSQLLLSGAHLKRTPAYLVTQIHPAALDLIATQGTDYRPFGWHKLRGKDCPSQWKLQPQYRHCYSDADLFMRLRNEPPVRRGECWVYVEGVTLGVYTPPMLHAWNAKQLTCSKAIDWNMYSVSRWNRYLGIPFLAEEHEMLMQKLGLRRGIVAPIFHRKHFPKIEQAVQDILASRTL